MSIGVLGCILFSIFVTQQSPELTHVHYYISEYIIINVTQGETFFKIYGMEGAKKQ